MNYLLTTNKQTRTAITLILALLEQSENSRGRSRGGLQKCMILAPKCGINVWKAEFEKWLPTSTKYKNINVKVESLHSGDKGNAIAIENFRQEEQPQVIILSYETFKTYNSNYASGFK